MWPKVWKWLKRTTKLMWQFWSCQIESDRGKFWRQDFVDPCLHPTNQCWLFCCLLQVARAGLEFQTKVVEDKRLRSANFLLFLFLWRLLRCFDTVFLRPYRYFSVALKVFFSLSDRYKIFTSNWLCIEICENAVLSKIDITMTTINKKLWNW